MMMMRNEAIEKHIHSFSHSFSLSLSLSFFTTGTPLCTLEEAASVAAASGAGTVVILRGGNHRINATIRLDSRSVVCTHVLFNP